jgi:hypothetical protein
MIRTARISEVGAIDNDSATNEPLIGGLLGACTRVSRACMVPNHRQDAIVCASPCDLLRACSLKFPLCGPPKRAELRARLWISTG